MKTILVDTVYTFVQQTEDGFSIFREMEAMLNTFPNRKILLTGADDEQFKKFGLADMPYEVFTLKHNPEKTNPEYYQLMLKHFGLAPDDVVYFEHDPDAVKSAQSVGITTYFWNNNTKPLEELRKFLEQISS